MSLDVEDRIMLQRMALSLEAIADALQVLVATTPRAAKPKSGRRLRGNVPRATAEVGT
jgi:hypothetical protein